MPVVEIACDESGFSGSNLLDPATPLLTHASVDLTSQEALALLDALRLGFAGALDELKSGRFLRGRQADEALTGLLSGLESRAHVHVVDKEFFLVTRVVDLFLHEPSYAAGTCLTQDHRPAALAVYRAGRSRGRVWTDFLSAFAALVRTKRRQRTDSTLTARFFQARDSLLRSGLGAAAERVLKALDPGRVRAVVVRLVEDDRSIPPPLEPMLPALTETVLHWSHGGRRVLVTHDEQSSLTPDRLRRLQQVLMDGGYAPGGDDDRALRSAPTRSPLAGLVTVDSRDDLRVQVADLLAGVAARRLVVGNDDGPLRPFVSRSSLRDPGTHR